MQNSQISKAIPWNPWHGCHKCSTGCKNCFVFNMDKRYGRDTNIITKGKTTYELKDKDCPQGSLVKLCFSSDFFFGRSGRVARRLLGHNTPPQRLCICYDYKTPRTY